jgi:uncharacterized membrane protein (UPF0127 family)
MNKKSESLLTLETERNENFEDATQKEPSSPQRGDMMSQLSAQESYENGKISDITETEQDPEVTVSLTKLTEMNFLDNTIRKISEKVDYGSILTYNINYSNDICDRALKYSSYNFSNDKDFLKTDFRNLKPHKKFSGFVINLDNFSKEDQSKILKNISASSRPICKGILFNTSSKSIDSLLKAGFKIVEENSDNKIFYVEKNDIDKIASAEVFDNYTGDSKALFFCDKAETIEDKIAGLQVYPKLKYGSGLVFSYDSPQDVMYHMGTVDFPIDIVFVDGSSTIKKVCSDIQPGTLGTFGAANVKHVVEVLGGSFKSLGINIGDKLKINKVSNDKFLKQASILESLSDKPSYFKLSKNISSKVQSNNFDVISCLNYNLVPKLSKTASLHMAQDNVSIFDFDDIIFSNNSSIRLFEVSKDKKSYAKQKDFKLKDFLTKADSIKGMSLIPNKLGSFFNFLTKESSTEPIARKMFFEMHKSVSNNENIIFVTRNANNNDIYKRLILKRAEEEIILPSEIWSSKVMVISDDLTAEDIVSAASQNFGGKKFKYISSNQIIKQSGIPIPDSVKKESKKAFSGFKKAINLSDQILENMEKNNNELQKLSENLEKLKSYKGLYNQSCKRNAKKIYNMLTIIKESLKIMNNIKDISSVSEKVDSLTLSVSQYVETAEDIFALVDKVNEPQIFLNELKELTSNFSKSTEDIDNNMSNFISYISKNILNEKILSR